MVEALNASAAPLSLTAENEDGTRQTDIPVDTPEERIVERLALKQALSGLEKKDKQLIYLRYFKDLTQTRTARILGMTQVQVSRREKKLLCAIREQMDMK